MSQYFDKSDLFLDPKVKQYGSHMVMSNVHKPTKTKYVNIIAWAELMVPSFLAWPT